MLAIQHPVKRVVVNYKEFQVWGGFHFHDFTLYYRIVCHFTKTLISIHKQGYRINIVSEL